MLLTYSTLSTTPSAKGLYQGIKKHLFLYEPGHQLRSSAEASPFFPSPSELAHMVIIELPLL